MSILMIGVKLHMVITLTILRLFTPLLLRCYIWEISNLRTILMIIEGDVELRKKQKNPCKSQLH